MAVDNGQIIQRQAIEIPRECYDTNGLKFRVKYSYLNEVEASSISYWSDGLRVNGFLAKPERNGFYPCVIFNRGGNRDFSAIDTVRVVNLLCLIASWGYVVVASQYRGNGGGEGLEEFGGKDINDVLNLIPLLEAEHGADPLRIGMWGHSRGGMMAYLALSKTDRIRAAVITGGLSDLRGQERDDMEEVYTDLIPGFIPGDDSSLISRSAICWTNQLCKTAPVLIMHGTADWRVNPVSALRLAEKLLANRHPFRLVMFEGSDHTLTEHNSEKFRLVSEWFNRYVRDKTPLPQVDPHGA